MTMYRLKSSPTTQQVTTVERSVDHACIPFDPANTDYANFKREIETGTAELQDANGQPMSAADANAYVATLP